MICEVCGREFEAKRSDAKYCGQACQKKAKRDLSYTDDVRDKLPRTDDGNVRDKVIKTPEEALKALKTKPKINKDRDNWHSPNYDLSEEGFRRRNFNWDDDGFYPGTPKSRQAFIEGRKKAHKTNLKRQAASHRRLEAMRGHAS
jgi:hypothetical protein